MKTKIKILLGTIFIFLCLLNINVITERDNNSKLSLSSIVRSAYAAGEDPEHWYYEYYCRWCEMLPGQDGNEYLCRFSLTDDCFMNPCMYGPC